MTGLGTVVAGDRTFSIVKLRLRDGVLFIEAHSLDTRAHAALPRMAATVYGEDGRGFCQGWELEIPATPCGAQVTIVLPLRITRIETRPGQRGRPADGDQQGVPAAAASDDAVPGDGTGSGRSG